jgi:hypothetical protein
MILLVCFLYVFFVGPIAAMNIGDLESNYPGALVLSCDWLLGESRTWASTIQVIQIKRLKFFHGAQASL